jgi:hypothetical protein
MRNYYKKLIESGTSQPSSASLQSVTKQKANTLAPQ